MKEYNYVNDLGVPKKLLVWPINENGKHPFIMWCMSNGEMSNSGEVTDEELKDFLSHYDIEVA